jgi:hypothetical protein
MTACALVFRSVHDVLKAEARTKERGFATRLIPVPKQINPDCGLALQVACGDLAAVEGLLADMRERLQGAYRLDGAAFTPLEPAL